MALRNEHSENSREDIYALGNEPAGDAPGLPNRHIFGKRRDDFPGKALGRILIEVEFDGNTCRHLFGVHVPDADLLSLGSSEESRFPFVCYSKRGKAPDADERLTGL